MSTPTTRRTRVLIADDHDVVRRGLRQILDADAEVEVVGEAKNGLEAVNLVKIHSPDVVVMDIRMPDMDGIAATREIKKIHPECSVLIFSMLVDHNFEEGIEAGISGYLLKDGDSSKVLQAIHQIKQGINPLSIALNKRLMTEYYKIGTNSAMCLTERQIQITRLVSEGVCSEEICKRLKISFSTEKRELRNIYNILGVTSRAQAVAVALKQGILSQTENP